MIIWEDDEEFMYLSQKNVIQEFPSNPQPGVAQPITPGYPTQMVDAMSTIADDIKSDIYHKTVGYGLIAVGAGVLVATRGAGWKASGIIMNTGLQNLAEVSK